MKNIITIKKKKKKDLGGAPGSVPFVTLKLIVDSLFETIR